MLKNYCRIYLVLILGAIQTASIAQGTFYFKDDFSQKINFEFINNLIVIPLKVNNKDLKFILDTGVSKPILFNLTEQDSLMLRDRQSFFLRGLGAEGELKAIKSRYNRIRLGNAVSTNQDLYVVYDEGINFTARLGVLVHGIIGYNVFQDHVIEINYNSEYIRLHKPESFKPKTSKAWKKLDLEVHNNKSYVQADVVIDSLKKTVKLLVDTGSSDAMWLFKDEILKPNRNLMFEDYLGKGLSGSVYGQRSKVNNLKLSDYILSDVNVAFPDSLSVDLTRVYKGRNGSLGNGILKRFNLFFDYTRGKLYLKKNKYFKQSFTYNNSGVVLEHNGSKFVREAIKLPSLGYFDKNRDAVEIDLFVNYIMALKPTYRIVEVRPTSNAYDVGLRPGDILIGFNGKESYNYSLAEINEVLHGKIGRNVFMEIERKGKFMRFRFKLDDVFKKNERLN